MITAIFLGTTLAVVLNLVGAPTWLATLGAVALGVAVLAARGRR